MRIICTVILDVDTSKFAYVREEDMQDESLQKEFIREAVLCGDLQDENIKEIVIPG